MSFAAVISSLAMPFRILASGWLSSRLWPSRPACITEKGRLAMLRALVCSQAAKSMDMSAPYPCGVAKPGGSVTCTTSCTGSLL